MKKVEDTQEQIKYEDYGYKDGTEISITSDLLDKICSFVNKVGEIEGTKVGFLEKEDLKEMLSPENKMQKFLTPIGMWCVTLSMELNDLHIKNVEEGLAVHIDELDKPKISLGE